MLYHSINTMKMGMVKAGLMSCSAQEIQISLALVGNPARRRYSIIKPGPPAQGFCSALVMHSHKKKLTNSQVPKELTEQQSL